MSGSIAQAFAHNFLGHSPRWYKVSIVAFLILNPLALWTVGPVAAGWLLVVEFIFTLAMALKCYPLLPGGRGALASTRFCPEGVGAWLVPRSGAKRQQDG